MSLTLIITYLYHSNNLLIILPASIKSNHNVITANMYTAFTTCQMLF